MLINAALETNIFFYLLKSPDLVLTFKPEFFNLKILKELFSVLKPFILEYKTEPTEQQTLGLIKMNNKQDLLPEDSIHILWESRKNLDQYDDKWIYENTVSFAEWANFRRSLVRMAAYVKTVETDLSYDNCKEVVERAKTMFNSDNNFNLKQSEGHDFFDPSTHLLPENDTKTSGYNFIDLCLNGGFSKKTLNVLMGSPKVGKSVWLCNLAAKSVLNGNNTIYITLELSYQKVSQRIGSNLFNIPMDNYRECSKDSNFMYNEMKKFNNSHILKRPGKFIIEEFPTSTATVYDIESFILKKEEELSTENHPFKFDNIFIDYINIMKDFKNPNSENMYQKIKSICEDVRAMAQRNLWCVISVTQTNRSAFDVADLNMSNVSESAGLIATVDSLFGIIQTAIMRVEGTYYLKAIAMRDSQHMGDKKQFNMNKQYLRIEECDADIIPENVGLPSKYGGNTTNNFTYYGLNKSGNNTSANVTNVNSGQQNVPIEQPKLGLTEITGQELF